MIRVLQVLGSTNLGGAESRIMDIYRHIDKDRFQFDFLVTEGNSGHFTPEIEEMGGHVYTIPKYRFWNHLRYKNAVRSFFEEHVEISVVHGHMTSTAGIYLPIAKRAGVKLTIAHARSAGVDKGIKGRLTRLLRNNISKRCDTMIACSDLAAVSVFGKDEYDNGQVVVLPNAIDVEDFAVNETARNDIRSRYAVSDKMVVGHVGRFHDAKNHSFLIRVFAEYVQKRQDAVLMLVGDGPLRNVIVEEISALDVRLKEKGLISIKDKVIFTGNQSPVMPFYQAFDLFLFPSKYEGMPGTVVEAQAAGLRCLISDTITRLVKTTDLVEFEALNQDARLWAEKLYSLSGNLPVEELYKERQADNDEIISIMHDSNYNVERQVEYYSKLYAVD